MSSAGEKREVAEDNGEKTLSVPSFHQYSFREIYGSRLPFLPWRDRVVIKAIVYFLQRSVEKIEGLEYIQPECDPFILAMNHNQKNEAIAVPALVFFHRRGRKVHFFSDWNFQLIPFVSYIIRRSEIITLTRKSAKPKFLNVLKPLFEEKEPPFDIAKKKLAAGASVGVYPEGTLNRNPNRLLKGYSGMARLSIESGCPIVPAGIRYPHLPKDKMIPDWEPMTLSIGKPMKPPVVAEVASLEDVRAWHSEIMGAISKLCGKEWSEHSVRKKQTVI